MGAIKISIFQCDECKTIEIETKDIEFYFDDCISPPDCWILTYYPTDNDEKLLCPDCTAKASPEIRKKSV